MHASLLALHPIDDRIVRAHPTWKYINSDDASALISTSIIDLQYRLETHSMETRTEWMIRGVQRRRELMRDARSAVRHGTAIGLSHSSR
jgi:hypothetical protein